MESCSTTEDKHIQECLKEVLEISATLHQIILNGNLDIKNTLILEMIVHEFNYLKALNQIKEYELNNKIS